MQVLTTGMTARAGLKHDAFRGSAAAGQQLVLSESSDFCGWSSLNCGCSTARQELAVRGETTSARAVHMGDDSSHATSLSNSAISSPARLV